jgi:hypothetical protein
MKSQDILLFFIPPNLHSHVKPSHKKELEERSRSITVKYHNIVISHYKNAEHEQKETTEVRGVIVRICQQMDT